MAQKVWLLLEQFTYLLLVVTCLAGTYLAGCLVCFSLVVEIQQRESSEVKYVGGARGFSKQLPVSMGSLPPYFDFQKVFF